MPNPKRAYGRPGTAVIPPNWQTDHAAVIEQTHPDSVTIGLAGTMPTFNEATSQTETTLAAPVYVGPASITAVPRTPQPVLQAEEQIPVRAYEISLKFAVAGITTGHVIRVDASADAELVGQVLRIGQVERDSRRFSRILLATLDH